MGALGPGNALLFNLVIQVNLFCENLASYILNDLCAFVLYFNFLSVPK